MPAFGYQGPFTTNSVNTENVASNFPNSLGSTSGTGYIYATDQVLDGTKSSIDRVTDLASTVYNDMFSGGFSSSIDDAIGIIDGFASKV